MTAKTCNIKGVTLSDIHLGHRRTPTEFIARNLEKMVFTRNYADLDVIFISGDLFDRTLPLSSDDSFESIQWLGRLINFGKANKIVVRLLEGTPSHEWKQTRILAAINEIAGGDCDVKWVSTLSIEHHAKLGVSILYIPDEWSPDPDDTWKQVQALLASEQMTSVDFTIMHGQFPYQLPAHVKAPTHVPERYQSITNYLCFCGHVHTHSVLGNIVVPGSFDRLVHGEEGPKGFVEWTVRSKDNWDVSFVENKGAKRYVNIDVKGQSHEEMLLTIDARIAELPDESHIRLETFKSDPIAAVLQTVRVNYPQFVWSTPKLVDSGTDVAEPIMDRRMKLETVPINPRTLPDLVKNELVARSVDSTTAEFCLHLIREALPK